MGLDIFFLEDVRNAIVAANEASSATAAVIRDLSKSCQHQLAVAEDGTVSCQRCHKRWALRDVYHAVQSVDNALYETLRAYREGYKAALITLALAFGVSPAVVTDYYRDVPASERGVPEEEARTIPMLASVNAEVT